MKNACKMVLFDLDGTLLDTLDDLTDSVNTVLHRYGCPERDRQSVRRALGNGARALLEESLTEPMAPQRFEQMLAEYRAYYAAHCCCKTRPFDGMLPLLQALREAGIGVAVVSNKPDEATQQTCRHYFNGYLDMAVGFRDSLPPKPQPALPNLVLSHFRVPAAQCVYVGDTEVDYQTALLGGMQPVLVSWGFRSREELLALQPPVLADTVNELHRLLLG